jgi:ATP/maltotriose-dependent transcriptional regulator MalT
MPSGVLYSGLVAALIQSAEAGLVGRELEIAQLERCLDETRAGHASMLAVAGEPGIGKTCMLDELERLARERGHPVLSGRALEFESDVPFAPLIDALDDHLRDLRSPLLGQLSGEELSELAAVFPAFADRPGVATGALEAERYRLHRAARELLQTLASSGPLVLMLDDLHWADEASLELLAYLLRRPPRAPLLIALTFRPRQASPALMTALDSAARAGAPMQSIELTPLSEEQAAELLAGAAADPAQAREIFEFSAGNPFYIEQLASTGRTLPELSHSDPPEVITAAIAEEVAMLRESAQLLLLAGVVLGDPFDGAQAVAIADLDPARARPLFEHLGAHDLLSHTDDPGRFAFRHPIVRAAIYAAAPSDVLVALHQRAAAELERAGASTAAIAHHVERCAAPGDDEAADLLTRAARESITRAPAAAAHWFEAALKLCELDPPSTRVELLVTLARALTGAGRLEAAHERLEEALALIPADAPTRSELIALCASIDQQLGRAVEAHARLVAALASLPAEPSPRRLALETELALEPAYAYRSSPESDSSARELATISDGDGDRATRASVSATLALRATLLGQVGDAVGHADHAASLLDALDEHELSGRLDVPHRLGGSELYLNRFEHASRHLTRGVALARATGQGRFLVPMLAHLAASQAMIGQLDPARSSAEDALDTARLTGPPALLSYALVCAGMTEIQAGDYRAAHAFAQEAHELAEELAASTFTAMASGLLATTSLELGDPARARTLFERSEIADIREPQAALLSAHWEALVRTLLALDCRSEAESVLQRIDAAIAPLELPLPRAHARRARAYLLLATAQPGRAAEQALAAATLAQEASAIIEAARARALAGQALASAGHEGAAINTLERATRTLSSGRAVGHRDHAARDPGLVAHPAPAPSREPARAKLPKLTPRQQEIARLVADGLTNQQIADELGVKVKTVEMHLTRAYSRLGVNGRAALAEMVAGAVAQH